MRVVLAHTSAGDVRDVRQALHGAGLECAANDCVSWDDLAMRLGQTETDLIVIHIDGPEAPDWDRIRDARMFTSAPLLAIGPNGDGETENDARQAGVAEYLYHQQVTTDLDAAIERLVGSGDVKPRRGRVTCIAAPSPGQGTTLVGLGIAAHHSNKFPGASALAEFAQGHGKISTLLDVVPEITLCEICERLHRLDRPSMARSLLGHDSGVQLLLKKKEMPESDALDKEAVRRICLLLRASMEHSVVIAGGQLAEPQLEAMRSADRVLMVLKPDVPTLTRAIWAIDRAVEYGVAHDRIAVALNYWGERSLVPMKQVIQTLNVADIYTLPYDPGPVNRAANEGLLFQKRFPRSRIGRAVSKAAESLASKIQS